MVPESYILARKKKGHGYGKWQVPAYSLLPSLELPSSPGSLPQPLRSLKLGRLARYNPHGGAHPITEPETILANAQLVLPWNASEPPELHRKHSV